MRPRSPSPQRSLKEGACIEEPDVHRSPPSDRIAGPSELLLQLIQRLVPGVGQNLPFAATKTSALFIHASRISFEKKCGQNCPALAKCVVSRSATEVQNSLASFPHHVHDLLARYFGCSCHPSHRPHLSGYDEPRTLSYQIPLFGPIGADVRQRWSNIVGTPDGNDGVTLVRVIGTSSD